MIGKVASSLKFKQTAGQHKSKPWDHVGLGQGDNHDLADPSVFDMTEAMARLGSILSEETELLSKFQIRQSKLLHDEKDRLVYYLQQMKRWLAGNPEVLSVLSEDERVKLKLVEILFNEIMDRYQQELVRARMVNRKMMEVISAAVTEVTHPTRRYDENGSAASHVLSVKQDMPSLTLNSVV